MTVCHSTQWWSKQTFLEYKLKKATLQSWLVYQSKGCYRIQNSLPNPVPKETTEKRQEEHLESGPRTMEYSCMSILYSDESEEKPKKTERKHWAGWGDRQRLQLVKSQYWICSVDYHCSPYNLNPSESQTLRIFCQSEKSPFRVDCPIRTQS